MSLLGALSSAVSALNAQGQAISIISDNLANASTYGYKTNSASFSSLVTASASTTAYSSGGVLASARSNISVQGLLTTTTTATNIAISGNGFFPVRDGTDGTTIYYTRNGAFTVDNQGYLVNNGYYLLGWPTDAAGKVTGGETAAALQTININSLSSIASATTSATLSATLPADANTGDTYTSTMEVYDSLGTAANVTVTWEKTGDNQWTATFSDPTLASNSSVTAGTVTSAPITINFNSDGTLASTSPSPATLTIGSWTTGAADSSIALNLGTVGSADGLSQYSTGSSSVSLTVKQDGVAYGTLTGVKVDTSGNVVATYDNGQTRPIYKIPVATFTNANGLSAMSYGIYAATADSGTASLHESGQGGAGSIKGSELEESTTDTNEEFSNMIAAQQAYSASAQVVTAVNKMFDTLISAVR
jgi:flagellar hook protein FlgE